MKKSTQEIEQEFLTTIEAQTGNDLSGWMATIETSNHTKTGAIVKWLKQEHNLNHLQATLLAGIYLNDGQPVYDYEILFNQLFSGNEDQLMLYRKLEQLIKANMPGVKLIPTKTYISIEGERCFATAKIKRRNIRVGLDLGDLPFGDYVQQAKGLGAMPRISHMVELREMVDINDDLLGYLQQAHNHVHS